MNRLRFVVLKNALSNLVRGGASSIVALALPHFLAKALSAERYSAWVLMLQIAAYANYLDFGVQTAVARFSAQALERSDFRELNRIVSSAMLLLCAAGIIAAGVATCVAWQIPSLFTHAPISILGDLRGGVLVLSAAGILLLPLSVFSGVLIGMHRNEFPALAVGITRLAGAAAVLLSIHYSQSLIWFAVCIGGFNVLGGAAQFFVCRKLLPGLRFTAPDKLRSGLTAQLLRYCAGLSGFNFAMLLVNGLDTTIVGHFAFAAAGYYGIAGAAIGLVTGLSAAIYTSLMAPMAVMQERREWRKIEDMVLSSTLAGTYANLFLILITVFWGRELLAIWVGQQYAAQAFPILVILVCAQAIRLIGSGYSIAMIATGYQQYGVAAAMTEGICNLLASSSAAYFWGPIGVAWGTLFGAVCGISCLVVYTLQCVKEIRIRRRTFLVEGAIRPIVCLAPILTITTLQVFHRVNAITVLSGLFLSGILVKRYGHLHVLFAKSRANIRSTETT